jgi:hypothetical protein
MALRTSSLQLQDRVEPGSTVVFVPSHSKGLARVRLALISPIVDPIDEQGEPKHA